MKCSVCGHDDDDLRMGVCFDCASAGDIRLAKRTTRQHWRHALGSIRARVWWRARMDFKMGWERIWRTGDYAKGGEWQDY